jgi:hypothetical protein
MAERARVKQEAPAPQPAEQAPEPTEQAERASNEYGGPWFGCGPTALERPALG